MNDLIGLLIIVAGFAALFLVAFALPSLPEHPTIKNGIMLLISLGIVICVIKLLPEFDEWEQ